jgi:hypothetical protein
LSLALNFFGAGGPAHYEALQRLVDDYNSTHGTDYTGVEEFYRDRPHGSENGSVPTAGDTEANKAIAGTAGVAANAYLNCPMPEIQAASGGILRFGNTAQKLEKCAASAGKGAAEATERLHHPWPNVSWWRRNPRFSVA